MSHLKMISGSVMHAFSSVVSSGISGIESPQCIGALRDFQHIFSAIVPSFYFGLNVLVPLKSKLVLIHPRCFDPHWYKEPALDMCEKQVSGHDMFQQKVGNQLDPVTRKGPCLYQLQSLIPAEAGIMLGEVDGRPMYGRTIGSTSYTYFPSGRTDKECLPGRFAALPLTGFCFVQGKKKDPELERSLARARWKLQEANFPMYDLDLRIHSGEQREQESD